jgi:hypothetical protein
MSKDIVKYFQLSAFFIFSLLVTTNHSFYDTTFAQVNSETSSSGLQMGSVINELDNLVDSLISDNPLIDKSESDLSTSNSINAQINEYEFRSSDAVPCQVDICVNPGDQVELSFECTSPDSRVTVTCKMLEGPAGATFESTTGNPAIGTFTWAEANPPGTYKASFQAVTVYCPPDINCIDSDVIHRTILVNHPPKANAGTEQSVKEKTMVTLQGSGSDEDNDPLTYSWTQINGPTVTLSDPSIANPTFNAPSVKKETTLTFQLIVDDGRIKSEPSKVNIIVTPKSDNCKGKLGTDVKYPTSNGRPLIIKASTLQEVHDKYSQAYPDGLGAVESSPPKYRLVHDRDTGLVCAVDLTVVITKIMPLFPQVSKLSPEAQTEWKRYIAALDKHENNHIQIVKKGYGGLGGYNGLIADMIGKTDAEAIRLLETRTTETQAAHDFYDSDTNHGATEGAFLNKDIK